MPSYARRVTPFVPSSQGRPLMKKQLNTPSFVFGPGGQAMVSAENNSPPAPQIAQPAQIPQLVPSVVPSSSSSLSSSQPPAPTTTTTQTPIVTSPPATESVALSTSVAVSSTVSVITSTASIQTSSTSSSSSVSTPAPTPTAISTTSSLLASSAHSPTPPLSGGVTGPTSAFNNPPSTNVSHSSTFYVILSLGIIVALSFTVAFIAWGFRVRSVSRRRRRSNAPYFPWENPSNDDGLESTRETSFVGMGDLATLGDRDVGEPKRAESILHSVFPPVRPATPFTQPVNETYSNLPILPESVAYPLPHPLTQGPYPVTRPLPPHLTTADFSVHENHSACSLGPLQVANMMPGDASMYTASRPGTALGMNSEYGTPREPVAGSKPRYWSLHDGGLTVPWAPLHVRSISTRLRGRGGAGNWELLPEPVVAGHGSQKQGNIEGWTDSLRSHLAQAFNAVVGAPPVTDNTHCEKQDKLTPIRPRRSRRRSIESEWPIYVGGELVGKPPSRQPTVSSTSSLKAWSLEETETGTDVVHVRGLGFDIEQYAGADRAWCPRSPESYTSSTTDANTYYADISRVSAYGSQVPLIATKNPPPALLVPDQRDPLSRASSVYSTASADNSAFDFARHSDAPRLPSIARLSRNATSRYTTSRRSKSVARHRLRPENIRRLSSSSNYSATSFSSEVSKLSRALTAKEEEAKWALRERQQRVIDIRSAIIAC